jgi:hypothetical protein
VNRVPRTGPRLVAERKRKESAEEARDVEDATVQQLIVEQATTDHSVDADVINDENEDASDLILQQQTFSEPLMHS